VTLKIVIYLFSSRTYLYVILTILLIGVVEYNYTGSIFSVFYYLGDLILSTKTCALHNIEYAAALYATSIECFQIIVATIGF
jgi:hypothetical protein